MSDTLHTFLDSLVFLILSVGLVCSGWQLGMAICAWLDEGERESEDR